MMSNEGEDRFCGGGLLIHFLPEKKAAGQIRLRNTDLNIQLSK